MLFPAGAGEPTEAVVDARKPEREGRAEGISYFRLE